MKYLILFFDFVLMNLAMALALWLFRFYFPDPLPSVRTMYLLWNAATLAAFVLVPPQILRERAVRSDMIAQSCLVGGVVIVVSFVVFVALGKFPMPTRRKMFTLLALAPTGLFISRIASRAVVRGIRRLGYRTTRVLFVGASSQMVELYNQMKGDMTVGYRFAGYFAAHPVGSLAALDYRGNESGLLAYLAAHPCDELYYEVSEARRNEAQALFDYCENHLIRFVMVPQTADLLSQRFTYRVHEGIPLMVPREEPLRSLGARFVKRSFDLVVSLGFLSTVFPFVLAWVAIRIKRSSPGPIFFRQVRTGLDGRDFVCLKFRSMHVNADADKVQATRDDPRKFPFGDFMRRTNIDELPQFINVLKGEMSLVGPRPHMVKHTNEYGADVDKYMVRLYVKPGITGWAQVNGCRGETKTVAEMEHRVRRDIWYLSHWSFWLDLRIIWMTVRNTIFGDKGNAY